MKKIIHSFKTVIKQYAISMYLKKRHVSFDNPPSFSGRWPVIRNEGTMHLGANCFFRSFRLRQHITVCKNAELKIAHNSFLNDGVTIHSTQAISIGHHAKIGDMTYIYDTDFHEIAPDLVVRQAPVIIGDNVWIGTKSIILADSVIGDHSVIAAGSIVTGKIPPKSLAAGAPARVIKTLDMRDSWIRK
jgi:maltose O-acetyltransferase